jgi:ATP-dependent Clp protease ATP-binding subunit ClpA
MAFRRFAKDVRRVVLLASQEEARLSGQAVVEAEHLLLALASHPDLRDLGLDRQELVEALAREEEQSLAAVGISASDFDLAASPRENVRPRIGTSAKLVLVRGLRTAVGRGEKRIQARHLLLGVLALEHGRVPRALRIAGVDPDALRSRL